MSAPTPSLYELQFKQALELLDHRNVTGAIASSQLYVMRAHVHALLAVAAAVNAHRVETNQRLDRLYKVLQHRGG